MLDEPTRDMLRADATIRAREARIVELEQELAQARAVITAARWYANEKHWVEGIVGDRETELGYHEPGKIPGEWGLMPGCRCGQCHDYWHADNGARIRVALATYDAARKDANHAR